MTEKSGKVDNADLINVRNIGIYNKREVCPFGKRSYVRRNLSVKSNCQDFKVLFDNFENITPLIKLD